MAATQRKTALVVGGTNGIGKEVARKLAEAGVRTVIVGRSAEKTAEVAAEIGAAEWLLADLTQQADVARLATDVRAKYPSIDYLVLTAGALYADRRLTVDGVEGMTAINYLWRFQFVPLVLGALAAAPGGARVLNVAGAGINADVYFDDPNFERTPFSVIKATWQAQQLNDAFTLDAQRLWSARGNGIQFHVVMPGLVETARVDIGFFMSFVFNTLLWPLKKSANTSAAQLVPLLLDPVGAQGGKMWDARFGNTSLKELTPVARLQDPEYRGKCWALSESLVKVKSPVE